MAGKILKQVHLRQLVIAITMTQIRHIIGCPVLKVLMISADGGTLVKLFDYANVGETWGN
jgi:hypothetical protein